MKSMKYDVEEEEEEVYKGKGDELFWIRHW